MSAGDAVIVENFDTVAEWIAAGLIPNDRDKVLALIIARYCNRDGIAFPGNRRLLADTGWRYVSAITDCIDRLTKAGVYSLPDGRHQGRRTRYQLNRLTGRAGPASELTGVARPVVVGDARPVEDPPTDRATDRATGRAGPDRSGSGTDDDDGSRARRTADHNPANHKQGEAGKEPVAGGRASLVGRDLVVMRAEQIAGHFSFDTSTRRRIIALLCDADPQVRRRTAQVLQSAYWKHLRGEVDREALAVHLLLREKVYQLPDQIHWEADGETPCGHCDGDGWLAFSADLDGEPFDHPRTGPCGKCHAGFAIVTEGAA